MKLGRLLSVVGVAASLALASTASAKVVSVVWTCNSDGFEHVVITHEDGTVSEWITKACGPSLAVGSGFHFHFADKSQILPGGRAFLNTLEKGGTIPARRVAGQGTRASRIPAGRTESIQLSQADVGPQLAAWLTGVAPDWRGKAEGPAKAFSIFDRWGKLITARGPLALVPGDVGLAVPAKGEAGDKRNAKERCLDKHGFWREKPKGEWGCWTSVK